MLSDATLRRRFGITLDQYAALDVYQHGRCAICQRRPGGRVALAVDHDHRTGVVRGLLDAYCNHDLLGHFGEDPTFYGRAQGYLLTPPAPALLGSIYVPGSVGAEAPELLPSQPQREETT